MTRAYRNFSELASQELEGRDFEIGYRLGAPEVAIMAPHGGKIEPGTYRIARAIAGEHYSFYGFRGIKTDGNRRLHLTSSRFDEPRALLVAGHAQLIITIHGLRADLPDILIGGRHHQLQKQLVTGLRAAGFSARPATTVGLLGRHPANLCNRGTSGMGVQLELSKALRQNLFSSGRASDGAKPTALFSLLTRTTATLIANHLAPPGPR
ncbi:MAG: poly-gamma-glutamate hydrolase family protein [Desulfopila sp.]